MTPHPHPDELARRVKEAEAAYYDERTAVLGPWHRVDLAEEYIDAQECLIWALTTSRSRAIRWHRQITAVTWLATVLTVGVLVAGWSFVRQDEIEAIIAVTAAALVGFAGAYAIGGGIDPRGRSRRG